MTDAALGSTRIDAVYVANTGATRNNNQAGIASALVDRLNLCPAAAETIENGPALGASALKNGFLAVASGMYDRVLVCGGERMQEVNAFEATEFARPPALSIVVHLLRAEDADPAVEQILARLQRLLPDSDHRNSRLLAGVVDPTTEIAGLPDAFRQAALALFLAPWKIHDSRSVNLFAELGPSRLLAHSNDMERLVATAEDVLRELLKDSPSNELFEALSALLTRSMSVRKTGSQLFFHYNTVRYRGGQLGSLTGSTTRRGTDDLAGGVCARARRRGTSGEATSCRSRLRLGGDDG